MTARLATVVTLHDTRFIDCRWWNDGWTENCRHLTVVSLRYTGSWSYWVVAVVCWLLKAPACVPQGRICPDNCTCCHTEIEVVCRDVKQPTNKPR